MTVQEVLEKLENKVDRIADGLTEDGQREIHSLVATLREEIETLAATHREDAESIAGYTHSTLREAAREQTNPKLLEHSMQGLATSVEAFESSHGRLVQSVNSLCTMLSNLGI